MKIFIYFADFEFEINASSQETFQEIAIKCAPEISKRIGNLPPTYFIFFKHDLCRMEPHWTLETGCIADEERLQLGFILHQFDIVLDSSLNKSRIQINTLYRVEDLDKHIGYRSRYDYFIQNKRLDPNSFIVSHLTPDKETPPEVRVVVKLATGLF
jgi:hypothetical protein